MKKYFNLVLILFICLCIVGCSNEKVNKKEGVVKTQVVESLEFTKTSLKYTDDKTVVQTTVTNKSDKDFNLKSINIKLIDKNGKEMITLIGYLGDSLKANNTKQITAMVGLDLTNAEKIEYSINK